MLSMIPALGLSLRVLDLSSCVALTNRTLQAICTYLTHLSVLRLAWCRELCDWGLLGLEEPVQGTQVRDPRNLGRMGWPLGSAALLSLPSLSVGTFKGKLRRNLRSKGFFLQPRPELEHQASGTKDPCPEPQGPSLLMLRALQELDLTACSKLTDASLAKVWGCGCG